MAQNMKALILEAKNTVKALSNGLIMQPIKATFMIIIFMVWEPTNGQMKENTQEIGRLIRCMGKAFLNGPMAEGMREITKMIKRQAKEYLNGKYHFYIKKNSNCC